MVKMINKKNGSKERKRKEEQRNKEQIGHIENTYHNGRRKDTT